MLPPYIEYTLRPAVFAKHIHVLQAELIISAALEASRRVPDREYIAKHICDRMIAALVPLTSFTQRSKTRDPQYPHEAPDTVHTGTPYVLDAEGYQKLYDLLGETLHA